MSSIKNKKIILFFLTGIILISVILIFFILKKIENSNNTLFISGNIETTEIRLSFQVPGKITAINTDEGLSVKKGDILAQLDKNELLQIKEQIRASLQEAELNYNRFQEDYVRSENLFKNGSISAQKRDTAKTNANAALAKFESLKAAFNTAELRLGYTDLISPIDGIIFEKNVEIGEFVQVGATIFTVADLNNVWFNGYIDESDLGRVKLNQEINIKTDSYPDKTYKGRLSFISQEAEFTPKQIQTKEERTKLVYRIKVSFENTSQELKPGMPVEGYIKIK